MPFRLMQGRKNLPQVCLTRSISIFAILVVLFTAVVFLKSSATVGPAEAFASPQTIVTVGDSPAPAKEVVQISIYPEGFWPTELEQKSGEFLLSINDRTGLPETDLVLKRLAGEQVREVRIPDSAAHWADVIDLPPGRYLLTESSHPEWQCAITITAR